MMKDIYLRELSIADIEALNGWRNTKDHMCDLVN